MLTLPKIDPSKPVLIAGPTASGKSGLAMQIAAEFDGVIVNADALQVYDNWRVLTARPSLQDEGMFEHALYGHVSKDQGYSVGEWLRDLRPILTNAASKLPIIVGGTGLYFSSLTNGLADIPEVKDEVCKSAEDIFGSNGLGPFLQDLEQQDAKTFNRIDRQNPSRVMRAWEVLKSTGQGLADWQDNTPAPMLPLSETNAFVLEAPKEWLTPRIRQRFDQMLDQGALDECRDNLAGWDPKRPASRAIGAPELMAHLRGELTLSEAIDAAEIATRRYAKRQRSWFRARMKDWTWINTT
ncbi:MAG: tRNA dimethylallyltransferase [Paracoccaceae bacterium]